MPNRDCQQQRQSIPIHSLETMVLMTINVYMSRSTACWLVSIRDLREFTANPYSTGVTLVE